MILKAPFHSKAISRYYECIYIFIEIYFIFGEILCFCSKTVLCDSCGNAISGPFRKNKKNVTGILYGLRNMDIEEQITKFVLKYTMQDRHIYRCVLWALIFFCPLFGERPSCSMKYSKNRLCLFCYQLINRVWIRSNFFFIWDDQSGFIIKLINFEFLTDKIIGV